MRLALAICLTALPLAIPPLPARADTIEAASRVVSVTLYPWGASVVRAVEFDAPAGVHDLMVPDLPPGTDAGSLRVAPDAGLKVGAVSLATGRLPAADPEPSAAVQAAMDEVERLKAVIREHDESIAAIRLGAAAAEAQVAFLSGLTGQDGLAALDPATLRDLARMVGEETLAAREAALAAEHRARAAERAKEDDVEAYQEARRRLEALAAADQGRTVLSMAVEAAAAGPARLEVTSFAPQAGWSPVYDLRLARAGAEDPRLVVERGALVRQQSGEDWRGVTLTLSTARPSSQTAPTPVHPWLRRIMGENQGGLFDSVESYESRGIGAVMAEAPMAAPVVATEAETAYQGATVTYRYPTPVDLRDGVDDLRLTLGELTLSPEVRAVAVPGRDSTAFLVAELTNTTGELMLPGQAYLHLDGAFVGSAALPILAAGDEVKMGFGAIDGIRLTRTVPDRTEGERGLLSSRNQIDEVAVLKVENLTGESWPVRVIDQVPYSEQDDLEITYTAIPPATETDVEGARGVLAWEFDLAAGASREFRLEHSLRWPDGYVLDGGIILPH